MVRLSLVLSFLSMLLLPACSADDQAALQSASEAPDRDDDDRDDDDDDRDDDDSDDDGDDSDDDGDDSDDDDSDDSDDDDSDDDDTAELTCGAGTIELGSECVGTLSCGTGTMKVGDTCVSTSIDVSCGAGTSEFGGECFCSVACADSDGDGVCDEFDVCNGFPESDDSDGDGTPDGCDACPSSFANDCIVKRAFVSFGQFNGSIGGRSAADEICQVEATSVGLTDSGELFRAYLSYSIGPDFGHPTFVWAPPVPESTFVRLDGKPVVDAVEFFELEFTVLNPLTTNAIGNPAGPVDVWVAGPEEPYFTCGNWREEISSVLTRGSVSFGSLKAEEENTCDEYNAIYCFEQFTAADHGL